MKSARWSWYELVVGLACAILFVAGASACTRPNPDACQDGACADQRLYCDQSGAIDGVPGVCIAVDCAPGEFRTCDDSRALMCRADGHGFDSQECAAGCAAAAGCQPFYTPGAAMSCSGDQLVACNQAGTATMTSTCALGCSTSESRCLTFEPSNGLGPVLVDAATHGDLVIPPGARIDTDSGIVQDSNGTAITVTSAQVPQVGALPIFAIGARNITIDDLTITGSHPIAFVASEQIEITGHVLARATGTTSGPGAQATASCAASDATQYACGCSNDCSVGAGGGGGYQDGGRGGAVEPSNAGRAIASTSPLAGGCSGGLQRGVNGTTVAQGGGGGGAVQLVASARVVFADRGLVDLGGGGGKSTTGGGAGGTLVVEAPNVAVSGSTAGVVANGGSGGGCGLPGNDGPQTVSPAPGLTCSSYFSGRGGTSASPPGNGCVIGVDTCVGSCPVTYGGGGGSVGRFYATTKDGTIDVTGEPLISVGRINKVLAVH